MDQFPGDVLPPEGVYESREAVLTAIQTWAKPRGYAFVAGKSSRTPNSRVKVLFVCDRFGQPRGQRNVGQDTDQTRRTTSRKTGCQFSVLAKESLDKSHWTLSHRSNQACAQHNHLPSPSASVHQVHRQLRESDTTIIAGLVAADSRPQEIRTYLYNVSETLATQQDIYNEIKIIRKNQRQGRSSIETLVEHLEREGFWYRIDVDGDNHLTRLFFAHPDSLLYLQQNFDILLLDCTYKTNKYDIKLLDMVKVDACQRSFCIAFAFLPREEEQDYLWALRHLRSLYQQNDLPSIVLTDRCFAVMNVVAEVFFRSKVLLCIWHVNKAIVTHCQPAFEIKDKATKGDKGQEAWNEFNAQWHSVVASVDIPTFDHCLLAFEERWAHGQQYKAMGYIKETWLPHKERFVKAWTDEHLHFGNTATSR